MSVCAYTRYHPPTAEEHRLWTWGGVAVIAVVCLAVEGVGSLVARGPAESWYLGIDKPAWAPPEWAFGPAWSALFVLMAAAGSVVWLARDRDDVCCPLTAFGVQLAANLAWVVLFFGMANPVLALVNAAILWVTLGLTVVHFYGVSRLAAGLLAPCWVWATFAAAVNASVVFMMK